MPYEHLQLPQAQADRPFVFLNMVCTLDGKTITGNRNEPVMDLGSPTDHATMRHLESLADAVLIGAGSLRATPGLWYPKHLTRIVATRTGDVPYENRFFSDCPEKALVVRIANPIPLRGEGMERELDAPNVLDLDSWSSLLKTLRTDHGVNHLLVEGGAELNAELLRANLVDEIFLTIAPKLKLGQDIPTMAGGQAFRREEVQTWQLVSAEQVTDEVFLRYRRPK